MKRKVSEIFEEKVLAKEEQKTIIGGNGDDDGWGDWIKTKPKK